MTWLSVHLFYEDLNALLTKAVFPFLKKLETEQQLGAYFFIRYSEGGKHVRLRIKTNEEAFLKGKINLFFNAFFKANPSQREREGLNNYPNNSVQYLPYEPEYDRYGGQKGIEVAEQQFHLSSEIARKVIENTPNWNYESAMGISIQFQLIFMSAVGFDRSEAVAFFDFYYKKWSTVLPPSSLPTAAQIDSQQGVINFIQSFWGNLEGDPVFGNQLLKDWYIQNRRLMLVNDLSAYYDSYLHLLNNRLGIFNMDEVFLAKLLHKSLT